ncbi:MAG: polysaccharide deacetylase family protein [Candidatus Nealsonbacteria bacterium]|nr:polysaccharide deacetylase family protein [Candidatus Nealsonbacteria bacterium]
MRWINFLHIYQPFNQSKQIMEKVTNECYRPLFKGLLEIPGVKINLNINAILTERLVKEGYEDVVENIRKLAEEGKLEFTETAKYHPLLPFLKEEDAVRQIEKNNRDNKKHFGEAYSPVCFFPPEMAYSPSVSKIVSKLGYKMILVDEISYKAGKEAPPHNKLLTIEGADGLIAIFRERRVSNSILSGGVRDTEEFKRVIKEDLKEDKYLCTAMDGETFGHHHPGLEKFLFKVLGSQEPEQIFFSELTDYYEVEGAASPIKSTWASSIEDIEEGIQFYSWKNPNNKVHQIQWKFLDYLLRLSNNKEVTPEIEEEIDKSLASDQFYWASGEPWWSLEMIEKGAWMALEALRSFPTLSEEEVEKGEQYYKEILSTAFQWQRSGKIDQLAKKYRETVRIPFKERTLEKGDPETYYAFLSVLKDKMKEAAEKENFEKAIMLRNGLWKIEKKNDIYDAMHVIDLLRIDIPGAELQELLQRYKEEYKRIQPGQPELRRSR